jgi:hypothetical protein
VARQVLEEKAAAAGLAGLTLGLNQVIVPDGMGRSADGFKRRMCGYKEAGRQGMYDDLDFVCPVLYQRFGSEDAGGPNALRKWIDAATEQGAAARA